MTPEPRADVGPDPYDPATRRKNVKTLLIVLAVLVGAALIPLTYRRIQQPESYFSTRQEAVEARMDRSGSLPGFVPAAATDIHIRHNRDSDQRFVRFTLTADEAAALTAGMRRLEREEVERVSVPTPGWSNWWPITSRTLSGTQGEHLQVYEIVAGPDEGYLAVDPRTRRVYFWSR